MFGKLSYPLNPGLALLSSINSSAILSRYKEVIPGLISRFYNAVSTKSSEISIWGTGAPLREFLYVEDFVNAIEFLLEKYLSEFKTYLHF